MRWTRNRVAGFTLVELLVVIGIISLLIGLLIPAVQSVREAARRTSCSNKVKQIGLALHDYESARKHFPSGIVRIGADRFASATWLTMILPYMEQEGVWDQALSDYRVMRSPFLGHAGLQTVLPSYLCPSDPESDGLHWTHDDLLVSVTDYLAVNGTDYTKKDGIFYLDSQTKFSDILDGTSNTIAAGERPPSPDFWFGWWYAGNGMEGSGSPDMVLGVREINNHFLYLEDCPAGPYHFRPGKNQQCDALHFWSYHPGGANFLFADGSVRLMSYDSDDILPALATRAGGEPVSF